MMLAIGVPMAVEIPIVGVIVEGHPGHTHMRFGMPAVAFMIAGDIGAGAQGAD